MKQLIVKLFLIVVVVLGAFTPIAARVAPTAIPSAHAVQHTQQLAARRGCYGYPGCPY
jgi:hypothetical protein